MAYSIKADECLNCGACEGECPNEAISEKDGKRVMAADKCVSCGCCKDACPADAIVEG